MKFTYEFANMKDTTYDVLLQYLKKITTHFKEIMSEIYNHRDLAILRTKKAIDDKTTLIMKMADKQRDLKPTIYKHEITIQEQLDSPKPPNFAEFPRPVDETHWDKLFERDQDARMAILQKEYSNTQKNMDSFLK